VPYRIDLRDAGDAAFDRLVDLGALDVEAVDGGLAAVMPDRVALGQVALALGVDDLTISPAIGRDADSVWTLNPRPIRVGSRTLRLADAPVFGTGQHPTTALCLELLAQMVRHDSPARVLDVGTGSGVLAIAALLLEVPRAVAIDVDAGAIHVAEGNARLNGVLDRLDLVCSGPDAVTGAWPLVLANILAAPLVEMAPVLVRRVARHGRLILSGIAQSAEADVRRAYVHLGMRHVSTTARAGWVATVLHASW
jgi:ribosomal protein L11 methyltransferase